MDADEKAAWREADRILDTLLDLPAAQRHAGLQALTLAPDLHRRVARLLSAHAGPAGPLDHTLTNVPGPEDGDGGLGGHRLGRWQLQEEIGRGGMAVVYRAVSVEPPVGQAAAVKVLTLGALASGGRERFLRERQLLARLRHPYIAPLYEAGVAEDGTPWLAMALVDGERIDAWCERRATGLEACIELLLQVAEALAYAHRNLVIHRDIKPSNVLVDGDGHVRLLDFGIARLIDELEPEQTATALRALTPEYAAPEQFHGAAPSTAMDVYGFGSLLYRMLSGRPPRTDGRGDTATGIQPPSRAVRQDSGRGESERRQWSRRLRGDLDTIVMKALAERPEARYASIEALAEDLRRWRTQRPVRARAPSFGYRLGKFVARNRVGVIAASLVLVAVGSGVASTLWQAEQVRAERELARAELARANTLNGFILGLFNANRPNRPREELPTTAELLDLGIERARDPRGGDPGLRADMLVAIGDILMLHSQNERADALAEEAVALARERTAEQPHALARALKLYARGAARRNEFDAAAAALDEAARLLDDRDPQGLLLLEIQIEQAWLLIMRDRFAESAALSQALWQRLQAREDVPDDLRLRTANVLASGYARQSRYRDAQPLLNEIVAIRAADRERDALQYAIALANAASNESRLGLFDEADSRIGEALAIYDRLFEMPTPYRAAARLTGAMGLHRRGRHDEAVAMMDQASREWAASRGISDPLEYPFHYVNRVAPLVAAQRWDEAETDLRRALAHFRDRADERLEVVGQLEALLAQLLCRRNEVAEAGASIKRAQAWVEQGRLTEAVTRANLHEATALCLWADARPHAALAALDTAAGLDGEQYPGNAAEMARRELLRAEWLDVLGRGGEADAARMRADEHLDRLAYSADGPLRVRSPRRVPSNRR